MSKNVENFKTFSDIYKSWVNIMKDEKHKEKIVDVHAYIPETLRDEFKITGLNFSVWLINSMEDEVYIQNKLREIKRNSVHQMGSQGVVESPDQPHPDQEKHKRKNKKTSEQVISPK